VQELPLLMLHSPAAGYKGFCVQVLLQLKSRQSLSRFLCIHVAAAFAAPKPPWAVCLAWLLLLLLLLLLLAFTGCCCSLLLIYAADRYPASGAVVFMSVVAVAAEAAPLADTIAGTMRRGATLGQGWPSSSSAQAAAWRATGS